MAKKKARKKPSQKANRRSKPKRKPQGVLRAARGTLFIVGGREDKENDRAILKALAQQVKTGKMVIATLATDYADEAWQQYESIFRGFGVSELAHLTVDQRDEQSELSYNEILAGAQAIFFTGGDQLKITTKLGGSRLIEQIKEMYQRGAIIAGTSAGAVAMGEMMLFSSVNSHLYKVRDAFQMVPGLGLLKNAIIDQHFSERGRIRRLLGAVSQNPRMVGIGIDEDTAIIVEKGERFQVIGSGAVYVADGREMTYTNISEASMDQAMSVFNLKLHILIHSDGYDLRSHQPFHKRSSPKNTRRTGRKSHGQ